MDEPLEEPTLVNLTTEILFEVLTAGSLDCRDLARLECTCKRFSEPLPGTKGPAKRTRVNGAWHFLTVAMGTPIDEVASRFEYLI